MKKTSLYARKRAAGLAPQRSDGIGRCRMHTTRLSAQEQSRIIEPCRSALAAMRSGRGDFDAWVLLCTAGHVAEAIEDGGIYRGQREIIDDANAALTAIGQRCGLQGAAGADAWRPAACTGPQLVALGDLVAAHARQVAELTYGEYTRAAARAVARVSSMSGAVFFASGLGGGAAAGAA